MAKKVARGRAKLAAKQAAQAQTNDTAPSLDHKAGKVSAKTKKKVANKVQFLQTNPSKHDIRKQVRAEIQESAASASKNKRKIRAKKPLNDLAGLNQALQDLIPIVQCQADNKAMGNSNTPKFKRSAARNQLQTQEQEHMSAVLKAPEFQSDPIKALTTHLQLAMGPAPEMQTPLKEVSKREKKLTKQRKLAQLSAPDVNMFFLEKSAAHNSRTLTPYPLHAGLNPGFG